MKRYQAEILSNGLTRVFDRQSQLVTLVNPDGSLHSGYRAVLAGWLAQQD